MATTSIAAVTPALPDLELVRSLPVYYDREVPEELIDENGHLNINGYFRDGTAALWEHAKSLGIDEDYLGTRRLSFFTVEHHIRYFGEMRRGDRYAVHTGFLARNAKAAHGMAYVVDNTRDQVACSLEIMYVHVSMDSRRSTPIPEDVGAVLDRDIAAHPWLAGQAHGLALR